MSAATLPGRPALPSILTPIPVPAGWFRLTRHDDPEPDPADDPQDPDDDPDNDDDPEPDPADDPQDPDDDPDNDDDPDDLGDAGKRALARMKAERAKAKKDAADARKAAAAAKRENAALAKKVAEFEDRDKSDLDKAKSAAERAQDQATKAVARSVKAEIRLGAAGRFADIGDATDVLMRDPAKYVDDAGEVDTDLIEEDLAALLERKPHWAAASEPAADPDDPDDDPQDGIQPKKKAARLKPDPGQGSRKPAPATDWTKVPKDEFDAHLRSMGVRPR
jgi:hypothetical protein